MGIEHYKGSGRLAVFVAPDSSPAGPAVESRSYQFVTQGPLPTLIC